MNNRNKISAALIGVDRSGKTYLRSAMNKMSGGSIYGFRDEYEPTIGIDFSLLDFNNTRLRLWDTGGQLRFESLIHLYLQDIEVFNLVIDPTQDIKSQKDYLLKHLRSVELKEKAQINLILTKIDLTSVLSPTDFAILKELKEEITKFVNKPIQEFKTSAKNVILSETGIDSGIQNLLRTHGAYDSPLEYQHSALDNVCNTYERLIAKRIFSSTDATRNSTLTQLKHDITVAHTPQQIKEALINAATDIRTLQNSKPKYGVTFFFGLIHYGSYKNSKLYQLIKQELAVLDNSINLEEASRPVLENKIVKPSASVSPAPSRLAV